MRIRTCCSSPCPGFPYLWVLCLSSSLKSELTFLTRDDDSLWSLVALHKEACFQLAQEFEVFLSFSMLHQTHRIQSGCPFPSMREPTSVGTSSPVPFSRIGRSLQIGVIASFVGGKASSSSFFRSKGILMRIEKWAKDNDGSRTISLFYLWVIVKSKTQALDDPPSSLSSSHQSDSNVNKPSTAQGGSPCNVFLLPTPNRVLPAKFFKPFLLQRSERTVKSNRVSGRGANENRSQPIIPLSLKFPVQ